MRDPELLKRIEKRISESKRTYARREQIAELLLRNDEFAETALYPGPYEGEWERPHGKYWINFLIRWGISIDWDCRKETLAECIIAQPEVFFRRWLTQDRIGVLSCGLQPTELSTLIGKTWAEKLSAEEEYIYIRIRSTTEKKDLENLWPTMEKIKKEIYGYIDREKQTFGRDLCWYDLNKKEEFGKMSLGRIRNRWISFFPELNPPSRATIQKAIERIGEFSFRLTPLWG
jgi:hypothetical protein